MPMNVPTDMTIVSSDTEADVALALKIAPATGKDGKSAKSESGDESGTSGKSAAGKSSKTPSSQKTDNQDDADPDNQDADPDSDDATDPDADADPDPDADDATTDADDQDADADPDADEDGDKSKGKEPGTKDKKSKDKGGTQKRFDKLTKKLGESQRETERLRQENARLAANQGRSKQTDDDDGDDKGDKGKDRKSGSKDTAADLGPKPKVKDFDTYDEYLEKAAEYQEKALEAAVTKAETNAAKRAAADIQKLRDEYDAKEQSREQTIAQEALDKRVEAAKEKYEDFDEVITTSDSKVSKDIHRLIVTHKYGQELGYYLAKNEDKAAELFALPLEEQLLEAGALIKGYADAAKPKTKTTTANGAGGKKVLKSKAAKPIPTTRPNSKQAGGVLTQKMIDEMPYEDYKRARQKGGALSGDRR